jgi:hypothetical protein
MIDLPVALKNGIKYVNYSVKSIYGQSPLTLTVYPNDFTNSKTQIMCRFLCPYTYQSYSFTVQIFVVGD